MKQIQLLMLLLLTAMLGVPIEAQADREVTQLQFGKQTITVASDEVITFYDWKGTDNISSLSSNNSQSLTVFEPAETGKSIQITFESCDVKNDGSSWPGKVYVYSGDPDPDGSFSYATSTSGVTANSTMPQGTVLAEMDGTYSDVTYVSTSSDGKLSVGMLWRYAKACSGWKATVRCVTLENMTVTGAGSNYDGIIAAPTERGNIAFANAFVTAEGTMNPDNVTGIWFTMTQNEGAVDPLSLKLYKGNTQVNATVAADGDGYKFTLNEAPDGGGTTTFTIKGDFLATASTGAKAEVIVTKVATVANASGISSFTSGTSVAVAAPAKVAVQPQFGKQVIEIGTEEEILFYDPWKMENIVANNDYNSQSLLVFKPVEAGKSIQITFEEIGLNQYSASYPLYINIYDGIADSDNAFTFPTTTGGVTSSSSFTGMTGTLLVEKLNDSNKPTLPAVYTSSTADGALSVAFLHRNSNTSSGWVAKVTCVQLENMTITGAGSNYDGVVSVPTAKQNITLANAYVTAEGVMNPDNVTGIYFNMTKNDDAVDPTTLKLYKGDTQVEATVVEEGTGYKFLLNEAPVDGTTTFTIKGDILGTAAVGAKVQVDITKIATVGQPNGITPFTAATAVEVENPALVIMTSTPQTITVGETELQFYDEGGFEGGISGTASGKVTFLSGEEGKKVMVDFSSIAINNGSIYYQSIEVYNGQSTNAADLLKTFRSGESGLVRSTADDGSLTVVLKAASQTTTLAGWEAQVSLFTPQAMDFNGITAEAASTETVCAGDVNQDMLTINVKAVNTEPAMKVTKMVFNAGDNHAKATAAALYFGMTKVGETTIEAASFEITLTIPQVLVEGDNVFTLKYTIDDEVVNGDKVSAQLVSVTALVNGSEKTESASSSAVERTVKNIVLNHADQGTVTKTVNGSLAFETKPKNEYSTTYETGTDDRINIFVPKHEGMVCQIDFESFKIYYYSYNVSSSAKFKIYNGQGTTGEVLWEPTTQSDYSNGPGKIIRSTAADGSLTVVFNPNQSYGTNDGWKATVSEYLSKDMAVTAIEATQASTADASIGASDQELLNVNVKTEGNLNAISMSGINLNLKGTEANISKVSVWQGETKLGEAAAAAEVTVTFSEAVTLAEGDNTFVVKVDVSADAVADGKIDAKVVSVKAGANDVTAEDADPEGARTLKLMYLLQSGDNGEMVIAEGRPIMFYDDGGAEANASASFTGTITFAPKSPADAIMLTFKSWNVYYTSKFNIFQKDNTEGEYDIQYSMYDHPDQALPLRATSENGKISIQFTTGSSGPEGFAIEVSAYTKQDVYVTSVTTEDISVNEVLKGQTDTKMLKIIVVADGEKTPLTITGFNFATVDNACISAQHIYQTGKANGFSTNEEFGESYTISGPGTYYFWGVFDVASDAIVGQTATMQLESITANGETVAVNDEMPIIASIAIAQGKSGTYTVGGEGADFTTIQAAINDLGSLGMEGPVVLNVRAGVYNERVNIPYIKGMGATNTLTIQSESGERDVKIYHDQYTSNGYSDDQYSKVYGVVTFYNASYVTLKGIEVTTTDQNYDAVIMVRNESRHITIDNCYIHAPVTTNIRQDVNLIGHYVQDVENKNNDYLTVKNCLLEGGYIGVSMGGTGNVALPKEVGGIIENNIFRNNGTKSIYVMDELGAKIRNNSVFLDISVEMENSSAGILDVQLRDQYDEPLEITGNTFNLAPYKYCPAISLRQVEASESAPAIVANNVVNMASLNASYSAFKFNGSKIKNISIANNTFRMTGTNGGPVFWASSKFDEGYGVGINVVNNIIQNETNGYAVNLYNDENLGKINFANNVMYTAGEKFYRASSDTNGDFTAFKTATNASNCINKKVIFLSENVLEPANTLDGDLLTAVALDYVTTDINGKERPTENITIGAYEYDTNADVAPVMDEAYPQVLTHLDGKASFSVKTDLAATVYYLVKKSSETAPTAEELKASETNKDVTANAEAIIEVEALEDNTEYIAYFLPVSLRGVQAENISQTAAFTMDVTPPVYDKPTAEIYINNSDTEERIEAGDEVSLFAMVLVDERTAPYTLTWMDQKHNVLETETYESAADIDDVFMATAEPTTSTDYYFTVTDAAGQSCTMSVRAIVEGDLQVATFEDLYVDPEDGFWMGDFSKGYDKGGEGTTFVSGSFRFSNYADDTWAGEPTTPYWGNYAYSQATTNTFEIENYITDQFNNAVGGGVDNSETFLVAFPQGGTIDVINNEDGAVIPGMYITNNAWAVDAILHGDGYSTIDGTATGESTGNVGFQTGDWFMLTISADNGNSIEYYLADYQSTDESAHYYVNDWQWIDLSSLGTVKSLSFYLTSSRRNNMGMTTPGYFCLDNIGAENPNGNGITTRINQIPDSENAQGIYSIDGKVLTRGSKQKGVQIVRMKDGSVRKVVR